MHALTTYCCYVILALGITACDFQGDRYEDGPPPLYKKPLALQFNPETKYDYNPLLDKIIWGVRHPATGDHIETGKPFLLTGINYPFSEMNIDTHPSEPVGEWEVVWVDAKQSISNWIESEQRIVWDALQAHNISEVHSDFRLDSANIRGIITKGNVPTGVPIPVDGKEVLLPRDNPMNHNLLKTKASGLRNFRNFGTPTGNESSSNQAIMFDSLANLWVTTGGYTYNNISRSFVTNYRNRKNQNLRGQQPFIDDRGVIWSARWKELLSYDGKVFRSYALPVDPSHFNTIFEDSKGNIWLGSNGSGLLMFDRKRIIYYTTREGLSGNQVFTIDEDEQNRLWIGTNNGISVFDAESFYHIGEHEGLMAKTILAMNAQNSSSIWLVSKEVGVHQINNNRIRTFALHDKGRNILSLDVSKGYRPYYSPHIARDSKANVWIATEVGLVVFNSRGEFIKSYDYEDGVKSNFVQDLTFDKDGNLFVAFLDGGISVRPANSISLAEITDDAGDYWEFGHYEDGTGAIWQGNSQQSVFVLRNDTLFRNDNLVKQFGIVPSAFTEDNEGNIWIGGRGGLLKYDGRNIYVFRDLPIGGVRSLQQLNSGELFVALGANGFLRLDDLGCTHYPPLLNQGLVAINCSPEDNEGKIWLDAAVNWGIFATPVIDGDSATIYSDKEGFFLRASMDNLEDGFGNRWFASRKGIHVLSGDIIYYIGKDQGLYLSEEGTPSGLELDKAGNVWVYSGSAITCITLDDKTEYFDIDNIITLTKWNGLRGGEQSVNSFIIDSDNILWLGNEKGTSYLDLNEVNLEASAVHPQLVNLKIKSEFIDYSRMPDSLRKNIEFAETVPFANVPADLQLDYNEDHLTFYFDANDWNAPDLVRFSYRLKGEDDNWSRPTAETMADYRNLSPGDYTFQLCAIGQNREWSEPLEYSFAILPPPWFAWYAWICYGLVLLIIAYQYRNYLIRQAMRKAEARVRLVEAEKIKELDEHKTRFFTNITHEFRTPLSLISGIIDNLNREGVTVVDQQNNLELLRRNSNRLSRLVNNLLELTKLDEAKMEVRLSKLDLVTEIKYHIAAFYSVAQSRNISFNLDTTFESYICYTDAEKLEIIIYNLLSNAFKYAGEYGEVALNVSTGIVNELDFEIGRSGYKGRYLKMTVGDNGPGISTDKLEKIFDRFEKDLSPEHYKEGMGIGLALTRELVHFLNGRIEVDSSLGVGTRVTVWLPVDKQGFDHIHSIQEELKSMPGDKLEKPGQKAKIDSENLLSLGEHIVLVAEDNEDLRLFLRQELGSDYKMLFAENGKAAWQLCLEYIPDIIVTDLMMPEMDGLELCKKVKEHQLTCHIPVIMLTAKAGAENRIEGHRSGADDYVQKPFHTQELNVKIANLIEQREKLKQVFSPGINQDVAVESLGDLNKSFMDRVTHTIEKNIDNPELSSEFIAENLNMSRAQLFRKFKAITGKGVSQFTRDYRLARAEEMLRKNSATVTEIAFACGFQSPSYFTSQFKKKYGVNPGSYLKKYNV